MGWKLWCQAYLLPEPTTEYKFHPTRKFALDCAWPEWRVGVEVQGGIRQSRASHSSYANRRRDMEKINEAQRLGWVILQFEWEDIRTAAAVVTIRQVIENRKGA